MLDVDVNWAEIVDRLEEECGLNFEPGLTESECEAAELAYGFLFPADLKQLLMTALPQGKKFPNWRDTDSKKIRDSLAMPLDGILFDVESNGIWLSDWGPQPNTLTEAKQRVSQLVANAPTLIPIYAHRMMPDRPREAGNPVYSVHQTDIIYYGLDLLDYLDHEFFMGAKGYKRPQRKPKPIDFWVEDRFQTRWKAGPIRFDNSGGNLP